MCKVVEHMHKINYICPYRRKFMYILWLRAKLLQLCLTLATPWTIACQAPLSVGFSRQEYWSGLPCPSPGGEKGIFLTQGLNPHRLHWQEGSLPLVPPGKPPHVYWVYVKRSIKLSHSNSILFSCSSHHHSFKYVHKDKCKANYIHIFS